MTENAAETVDPVTGEIQETPASTPAPAPAAPASTKPGEAIADKNIRSFATLLSTLENGSFNADLSKQVRDLIADMNDHQAAYGGKVVNGEVSISLSLKLQDGIMEIYPEAKVKAPKAKRGRSIFFVTPENNLSQENPKQRNFDFGGNTRPIR